MAETHPAIELAAAWKARAERAEATLASVRAQAVAAYKGVMDYVLWNGGVHVGDCPEDDTCDCEGKPINAGVNAAIEFLRKAGQ